MNFDRSSQFYFHVADFTPNYLVVTLPRGPQALTKELPGFQSSDSEFLHYIDSSSAGPQLSHHECLSTVRRAPPWLQAARWCCLLCLCNPHSFLTATVHSGTEGIHKLWHLGNVSVNLHEFDSLLYNNLLPCAACLYISLLCCASKITIFK